VHDVGARQPLLQSQVALAERTHGEGAGAAAWQPPRERVHRHAVQLDQRRVVVVVLRDERLDPIVRAELLPRPKVPGVSGPAAEDDDPAVHARASTYT
jgi:hypothetical protein